MTNPNWRQVSNPRWSPLTAISNFFNIFNHAATLDQDRSNHFIYRENINAAYINFSQEYASFDFQVGIRMEHTHTHGNQQTTGESFTRDYAQLFPTLFLIKN
ncbi:MAG: outer membrane beta-barrel protein [Saprospiraceae bacterium]|nr:outer membrane beta-barrel protein [Saprospiraceae bacterium]